MEMFRGFFGCHCLSWITRRANEPVSTVTVTEWGVCIVTHCITAYGQAGETEGERRTVDTLRKEARKVESTSDQSPALLYRVYSIYQRKQANAFSLSSPVLTSSRHSQSFHLSGLIVHQNLRHTALWIHPMHNWRDSVNGVYGAQPQPSWFSNLTRWQTGMWLIQGGFA